MREKITFFWFRRDLRLDDNAGFYQALKLETNVCPIFIFDKSILEKLEDKSDSRVSFIYQAIQRLKQQLVELGSNLRVEYGYPLEIWKKLSLEFDIQSVYTNHDYEPYGVGRDQKVKEIIEKKGTRFHTFKDIVIFEKEEVTKDDGKPYTVFTPYSKKWKAKLNDYYLKPYPTKDYFKSLYKPEKATSLIALEEMGYTPTAIQLPSKDVRKEVFINYSEKRNFPATRGTSQLGTHLRFGLISIRKLAKYTKELSETYLNELIWRDFYQMILHHYPHVVDNSFKPKYDLIEWRKSEEDFQKWCDGNTGYPIVDAGMRELNQTGFMHNRVRMIVASFLTKHLLLDWRLGEAYFANKLLDFELASNNGGWQWAAGTGCDAAPYFRVFNPYTQTEKFDKQLEYIKKWVPEFQELTYPQPMVDHKFARERALKVYKEGLTASQ